MKKPSKWSTQVRKSSSESINYRKEYRVKEHDPRYDGWQECFKNVRKTGAYGKLSYCL